MDIDSEEDLSDDAFVRRHQEASLRIKHGISLLTFVGRPRLQFWRIHPQLDLLLFSTRVLTDISAELFPGKDPSSVRV
jgi:hypothetical protein